MRIARAVLDALRLALAREELDAAPPPATAEPARRPGVLHVLFVSREPLGFEPVAPPPPRRSFWRALLAPEPLPYDPVPPPRPRRRGRLAALFALERLDGDPEDSP